MIFTLITSNGMPDEGQILGVIVGGLIGFGSSYAILRAQRRDKQRAIALGFRKELEIYRGWLGAIAKEYSDAVLMEIFELPHRPIITQNSLYYVLRKEMFFLDSNTVEGLLTFYSWLLAADESRKKALGKWPKAMGATMPENEYIIPMCEEIAERLDKAAGMVDDLIRRLKEVETKVI